jgi:hypothetical protein
MGLLAAVAVVCGSGCTVGGGDGSVVTATAIKADARDLKKNGYAEQAAMLEDGDITAQEYQEAFDLLRACIDNVGAEMEGPWTNPVDGISLSFTILYDLDMKRGEELTTACQERYFTTLDGDYLELHPGQMDPLLREAVSECMVGKGFESSGDELTVQDFAGEGSVTDGKLTPRGEALTECVRSECDRLFPRVGGGFSLD